MKYLIGVLALAFMCTDLFMLADSLYNHLVGQALISLGFVLFWAWIFSRQLPAKL